MGYSIIIIIIITILNQHTHLWYGNILSNQFQ
jgi:hypothetical protein